MKAENGYGLLLLLLLLLRRHQSCPSEKRSNRNPTMHYTISSYVSSLTQPAATTLCKCRRSQTHSTQTRLIFISDSLVSYLYVRFH